MPRMARLVLPRYAHHVVQRGHNKQVVFAEARDYARYLETLREFKGEYAVKVYAFCLMTNHVHLLLSPRDADGLGKLMKRLSGRQTRHHNKLEGRSGTLWEGRYKSSVVETDGYLLACCRYIELNPVRARLVAAPEDYRWSSCRYRFGREDCEWLDMAPSLLDLGSTDLDRLMNYRKFLREAIPEGQWQLIREALQRGQLTGSRRFASEVEDIVGRRIERRARGRPRSYEMRTRFEAMRRIDLSPFCCLLSPFCCRFSASNT